MGKTSWAEAKRETEALSDEGWVILANNASDIERIARDGPNDTDGDARTVKTVFVLIDAELDRRRVFGK